MRKSDTPLYIGPAAQLQIDKILNPVRSASAFEPEANTIASVVSTITHAVATHGDTVLHEYAQKFNDPILHRGAQAPFEVTPEQWQMSVERVPSSTVELFQLALENISRFNQGVCDTLKPVCQQREGYAVGLDWAPVESVACYVPSGRYPLPSTALMTAVTAKNAGVKTVILLTPNVCDDILLAAQLAGVDRVFQLGGAQAISAVAFGTQSIPKVDMVVGPGNAYVTEAKRQLQGVIGIDMLAGPSEVGIIADNTANPDWVASDLIAQSEHDPNSRAYLLTDSLALAQNIQQSLRDFAADPSFEIPDFACNVLHQSGLLVLASLDECIAVMNQLSPEHLELLVDNPEALKPKLKHYGALFMGHETSVPVGDYLAGPNHTLPTGRSARFSGALTPLTFLRPQTWTSIAQAHHPLQHQTQRFATLEGLTAHAQAARQRA